MKISMLVLLLCLFVRTGAGTDLYVSTTGKDNNPGTKLNPFRTIQKAQLIVRKIVETGMADNIRININRGVYRLTEPLIFDCRDSGNEKYTITYRSVPDEDVVISGGKVVAGWNIQGNGSWKTDSVVKGTVRELFVNGQRAQRARHPNHGYLRVVDTSEDRMSYFTFNPEDIPASISTDKTELVFIHDWSISRVGLKSIDKKTQRIYPLSKIGRQHPMMVIDGYEPNPRYALENHPAICDTAGEWCQDSDGKLIYYPGKDEEISETEFIAPSASQLLVVRGDEKNGCMVNNLHFEGLTFEHCAFTIPEDGYAGVQATFHMVGKANGFEKGWRGFVPAAIHFELAENCHIKNSHIRHLGGAGVMIGSRTKNCSLVGSIVNDISGNAVMIGESRDRIVEEEPWWQSAPQQVATGNQVVNCLIENSGVQYFGAIGIWVGLAQNTLIAHNEIRNLPYTGISIGWMWSPDVTPCKSNVVSFNHIHHVMQILSDGGGIYTLGYQPGTILESNLIHDVPLNAGRAESNGMFLDEGTTDIVIRNNGIYNTDKSPLRFHKAGINKVEENVLGIGPGLPPVRYNNTPEENI